jgi:glutamate carboxypeptidase
MIVIGMARIARGTPTHRVARFETARLLADLEALVARESPSDDAEAVTSLARFIAGRLRAAGVRAETRPCPPRGEALLAGVGGEEGGTLLLGHHDTVWPKGTLGEIPWAVRDGRATGPGVFDMKAGIAVAIAVLEALGGEPAPPPVALLLTPDEELGTEASRGLLLEVARRHRRVLVLEPSLDGAAKVARKGTGGFEVRFRGRAAHAGLDPEKGASALLELAHFAVFAAGLSRSEVGTTVTPTGAQSGTRTNVVPEAARLALDCRAWSQEEVDRVSAALRSYRPRDPRVVVEVEGGFDRPPLEPTPASTALFEEARSIAAEIGFALGAARVGGASDGNLTAAAGLPTLDGLGPLGEGAHARHEWASVEDLARRAELLFRLAGGGAS